MTFEDRKCARLLQELADRIAMDDRTPAMLTLVLDTEDALTAFRERIEAI